MVQLRTWVCDPAKVASEEPIGPVSNCNDSSKQVNFILPVKCTATGRSQVLSNATTLSHPTPSLPISPLCSPSSHIDLQIEPSFADCFTECKA